MVAKRSRPTEKTIGAKRVKKREKPMSNKRTMGGKKTIPGEWAI
jgi:hypothetical protein